MHEPSMGCLSLLAHDSFDAVLLKSTRPRARSLPGTNGSPFPCRQCIPVQSPACQSLPSGVLSHGRMTPGCIQLASLKCLLGCPQHTWHASQPLCFRLKACSDWQVAGSAAVSSQQLQNLVGPGPANPSRPVNIGDAGVAFILAAAGSIPGGAPTVRFPSQHSCTPMHSTDPQKVVICCS